MEETDNKQGNRLALRAKAIADRAIAFGNIVPKGCGATRGAHGRSTR